MKRTSQTGNGRQLSSGDYYLSIEDPNEATSVSREITDLIPGEDYVAEVYVENNSDEKAWIKVIGGETDVDNFAIRSLQKNYVKADSHASNNGYNSKMQRMQVAFTAKSETAKLMLMREAGEGETIFDDIRIVQKSLTNHVSERVFKQDFESVVQGLYPFVMGNTENVEDNRIHLSELNAPYTQKGWADAKLVDDVIGGNWSIKVNTGNAGLNFRTIPQHFYFEPGEVYEVSFDYQTTAESYRFISGDQAIDEKAIAQVEGLSVNESLEASTDTNRVSFRVTGSSNGQQYIGIFNDGTPLDMHTGAGTFVLDNLRIEHLSLGEPTLEVRDYTMDVGEALDLRSLIVSARDSEGTEVIDDVVIDQGEYDANEAGIYSIVYTLTEEAFDPVSATAYVTVGEEEGVDVSALIELMDKAKSFIEDEKYTEASRNALSIAVTDAKAALDTIDTEDALAEALENLQAYIDRLVLVDLSPDPSVDKQALEARINEAEALDLSSYTETSVAQFTDALIEAKSVRDREDVTQADVDQALAALDRAIDGLETDESSGSQEPITPEEPTNPEKPTEPEDSTPVDESQDNTDSSDQETDKDTDTLPNTATHLFNWLLVGAMFLSLGIVLLSKRRKSDTSSK